jgi:hypothetical protein
MKKQNKESRKRFPGFLLIMGLVLWSAVCAGCIRVQGGAGYTTLRGSDGEPTTRSAGFDTDSFLPAGTSPGNIDVGE